MLGKHEYNSTFKISAFVQNGLHVSLKEGTQTTDGKAYGASLLERTKQNF